MPAPQRDDGDTTGGLGKVRTNFLLIHADQHRYDCMGVSGHPLVHTPNLDRLAAEGMFFSHAFCPVPVCAPSRASLLFGTWPSRHESITNTGIEVSAPVRDDLPAFTQVLSEHGYHVAGVGKWGIISRRTPQELGFDVFIADAEYRAWRKAQGIPDRPSTNGWFGEVDPYITPEKSRLAWGADRIIELLRERARERAPFFLRWDPPEPHLPNVVPEPYATMYDPADIEPWPSFAETFVGKPYIQRQQLESWGIADWTWDDWRPVVSRYLGEITLLDAQVGRILDALDELGLAEETMVVYTTDHGDMCGGHRMIDKHYVMYDDVVRVPLIVRWPGRIKPGSRSDAFVATGLDLARTFLEAAELPVPQEFQGESLLPVFRGESNGRESVYAVYHGGQFGLYSQRMVRTREWKYVWNPTAEDELYHLATDPAELHNRAADRACADVLKALRRLVVEWMEATGDRLLNHWTRRQLLEGKKMAR